MNSVGSDPSAAALAALARVGVSRAADRLIKTAYLHWVPPGARVLDVGCGEGAFLDVARAAGRRPVGVDRDVALARAAGHEAHAGDAIPVLRALAASHQPFEAAILSHVIEHQAGAEALSLVQSIAAVLSPGAPLVVVTPNYQNYIVNSELFWLDPTHVRPYPRRLLERLLAEGGFEVVASFDDGNTRPRRSPWRNLVARLRSVISGVDKSGPLDSIVVGRRR